MSDYRNLAVWANARKLAVAVYKQTAAFPLIERTGLGDQMRRAIISAAVSIADAHGRGSRRERRALLLDARGAMYRLQTHILISSDLGYLPQQHADAMVKASVVIGRQVTRLIQEVTSASSSPSSQSLRSVP